MGIVILELQKLGSTRYIGASITPENTLFQVDAMKKCITNINKLYKKNADDLWAVAN